MLNLCWRRLGAFDGRSLGIGMEMGVGMRMGMGMGMGRRSFVTLG